MTGPIAALVLAATLAATPTTGPAADGCPEVTIIGVAGSGQGGGVGPQVEAVVGRATEILGAGARTVTVEALDYPAIDLGRTLGLALFDGRYRSSVDAGVESLRAAVADRAGTCPDTAIVLVGYSQGAQVIREALNGLPTTAPVAAIALLADPTASRGDDVVRLGADRRDDGSLGAVPVPVAYLRRTIDVCAGGDVFCGSGRLVLLAHSRGYASPLSDRTASWIAVRASAAAAAHTGRQMVPAAWGRALIR